MKTRLFTVLALVLASTFVSWAQPALRLSAETPTLIYSLPKTEFLFELVIEKTVEKPGPFVLYAQRFLGATKAIQEETVSWRLVDVRVSTQTTPDPARRYAVSFDPKSALSKLVVDPQGILTGVNTPLPVHKIEKEIIINDDKKLNVPSQDVLLPLSREYLQSNNVAKMAEGTANYIQDLRSSRMNLLVAEVEQMPSEGALAVILAELDRREKEMVELFVGSVRVQREVHRIKVSPEKGKLRDVLFRISAKRGVVARDDMSGEPIFYSFTPEAIPFSAVESSTNSKEKVGLYSIYPARTQLKVDNGVDVIFEESYFLPQFGELMPLPESLFKSLNLKLSIDPETGRLLKLEN